LHISEAGGRVRLGLDGFSHVEGATLQEAADELVAHMVRIAMAFRAGTIGPMSTECCPDPAHFDLIWRLGEHVAAGGDPRHLLFGVNPLTA
jgi:hypothetical protein